MQNANVSLAQHVSHCTTKSGCRDAAHDAHDARQSCSDAVLRADDAEGADTKRVGYEMRKRVVGEVARPEDKGCEGCEEREVEILDLLGPEGLVLEEDGVADGTTADCGDGADEGSAEDIHAGGGCKKRAGVGEGGCAEVVEGAEDAEG